MSDLEKAVKQKVEELEKQGIEVIDIVWSPKQDHPTSGRARYMEKLKGGDTSVK